MVGPLCNFLKFYLLDMTATWQLYSSFVLFCHFFWARCERTMGSLCDNILVCVFANRYVLCSVIAVVNIANYSLTYR